MNEVPTSDNYVKELLVTASGAGILTERGHWVHYIHDFEHTNLWYVKGSSVPELALESQDLRALSAPTLSELRAKVQQLIPELKMNADISEDVHHLEGLISE